MRRLFGWLSIAFVATLAPAAADPLNPENLYLLLMKVAAAPHSVSYSGTYTTERVRGNGVASFTLHIEHYLTGRDRVMIVEPNGLSGRAFHRDAAEARPGDRMGGFSPRLIGDLSLLLANYSLAANEGETIAGRPTYRIDITPKYPERESKGIWIDQKTGIVLKVETVRPNKLEVRDSYFTDIRLTPDSWSPAADSPPPTSLPAPLAAAMSGLSRDGWLGIAADSDAEKLSRLTADSRFDLLSPGYLPQGFVLNEVHQVTLPHSAANGDVHLLYSDGLTSISLFLEAQEPIWPDRVRRLILGDPIARRIEERGFMVLDGEKSGTHFVLVSDIGGDDLNKMAASLVAVKPR